MKAGAALKKTIAIFAAAGCVGLFVARLLNELVPDALGIGIGMFAAGALGGFCAGIVTRRRHDEAAELVGRALERGEKVIHSMKDE